MRKNKIIIIIGFAVLVVLVGFWQFKLKRLKADGEITKEIQPVRGSIEKVISTTGTVLPRNRLEVKPPVNGRIDEILVKEGERVKVAQTLAWMSSTERAALLDAARGQDEKTLTYWQEVYKPIPIISSIDAEVIVAKTQPGQTVTTSDAVVVLSDELIIRAQVDESDIGSVRLEQNAMISLDAYPDTKIKAKVGHIYYESKTVNNVTIYEVDLIPETVEPFFRSGMNASINFIEGSRENALLIPLEAVIRQNDETFVLVKENGEEVKRSVELGLSDNKNVEVISGIDLNDTIIVKSKQYVLPKTDTSINPFMPRRGGATQRRNGSGTR